MGGMKRFLIFGLLCITAIAGTTSVYSIVTRAAQAPPMTEAHIARIRSNCVEAQSTLDQLHASDALLRVNRGQLYESISEKLMAPFNSRVALNRLDGTGLIRVATDYERQLADFRTKYQEYEEAMSQTLRINCMNEPVAFYDSVSDTRAKRQKVHASTVELHKLIGDYKNELGTFAKEFRGSQE